MPWVPRGPDRRRAHGTKMPRSELLSLLAAQISPAHAWPFSGPRICKGCSLAHVCPLSGLACAVAHANCSESHGREQHTIPAAGAGPCRHSCRAPSRPGIQRMRLYLISALLNFSEEKNFLEARGRPQKTIMFCLSILRGFRSRRRPCSQSLQRESFPSSSWMRRPLLPKEARPMATLRHGPPKPTRSWR